MSTLAEDAILALPEAVTDTGAGLLPPFQGFGSQGTNNFRGERYRATETPFCFRARSAEMLGTTDKYRLEKVWYECEMIDILRGASILTCEVSTAEPLLYIHTKELISNGETTHKVRALVSNGRENSTAVLGFFCQCSDGSERYRYLRIRVKP